METQSIGERWNYLDKSPHLIEGSYQSLHRITESHKFPLFAELRLNNPTYDDFCRAGHL